MSQTKPEPATAGIETEQTSVGSVFVSNYPPYSVWNESAVPDVQNALTDDPSDDATLGLYLHIPFCRKRCKFCYFRVYTDKNSTEIDTYLNALAEEIELYGKQPALDNRPLKFVYFGGGTPSYISVKHLNTLVERIKKVFPWDTAEEVAFECEPGTLTQKKLQAIKGIGVTRLSLGVENLNDKILEENGRAHLSKEVYRIHPWIKELEFDQVNIDLISGMIGETWESWQDTVQKTIELDPDSITVYQLELPFNTVYSKDILGGDALPVADWKLKREWHQYAFEQFTQVGYEQSSAYTVLKKDKPCKFVYRDAVWQGSDMIGTGVASFSHFSGIHFQNAPSWGDYLSTIESGELPIYRAFKPTDDEKLTREMILQLKLGKINPSYFQSKFNADILALYREEFDQLQNEGMLRIHSDQDEIQLTQRGLLQVDGLLPTFYAQEYQNTRYT
ncbi:coproporphyrinogen III oxidase family protein [Candidatus Poribacteria bacterium]|nr:coproporphyrinogen III oxidase family protein [Candidatus Poribacteria bacterium]